MKALRLITFTFACSLFACGAASTHDGPSTAAAGHAHDTQQQGEVATDGTPREASAVRLVAVLPMQEGYGEAEHDAYEATIAPIAADHGMKRDTAYTVTKYLGGRGPQHASTLGVWTLASPTALQGVMGDARYQAQATHRDRIHDMPHAAMYMTREEPVDSEANASDALLVGLLVMNDGYDFDDHAAYEKDIEAVTSRHGMRLVRAFRVMKAMGGAEPVQAINVWALDSPAALKQVMSDPDYIANIHNRDRMHNMAATTMYFVARRGTQP